MPIKLFLFLLIKEIHVFYEIKNFLFNFLKINAIYDFSDQGKSRMLRTLLTFIKYINTQKYDII